ncbi:MAG: ABC transporter ATP-binding protein, partial [Caulobacteraceae bacterium]|nr:ABC transporter ATP-binding protein [Caulobacter sp.]
ALARLRIEGFDIRARSPAARVRHLSGGNIQKVLLARELSREVRVAILAKPTHGLDARNAAAIRDRIRAAAAGGAAVLLIASDLDEILDLSHRIAVMAGGRIRAVLPNGPGAAAAVVRLMSEAAP